MAQATARRVVSGQPALPGSGLADLDRWRIELAQTPCSPSVAELNSAVNRAMTGVLYRRMAEERGLVPRGEFLRLAGDADVPNLLAPPRLQALLNSRVLGSIIERTHAPGFQRWLAELPVDALGAVYEHFLATPIVPGPSGEPVIQPGSTAKKAAGVYYTPRPIIDYVVAHTVGELVADAPLHLRIVDPACGAGAFLLRAYDYLLALYGRREPGGELSPAERVRILCDHIHGVDIDPQAVELTRQALLLRALAGAGDVPGETMDRARRGLDARIVCGNALIEGDFAEMAGADPAACPLDWERAFPEAMHAGGFDAVIGNPPWGQKAVSPKSAEKQYIRRKYPSTAGIFDLFRPFVERGTTLVRAGAGRLGLVLPDIVLLKNYPATRRFLLDNLVLERIDWWGMAFPGAVIDAATIIGRRGIGRRGFVTAPGHRVKVAVHRPGAEIAHEIQQEQFLHSEGHAFNLFLTADRRRVLDRLADRPRLGDYFAAHEGVHSGNMRSELFLDHKADSSCVPLLFGRDEIAPYGLRWRGKYLRLGVAPQSRSASRYANLGRAEWFARDKLVVRRTGDRVLAAVDRQGRHASNNFFVMGPEGQPCFVGLDGLCALLNSSLMTWFFRAIEPRQGRVFAELKIKHLRRFPLPEAVTRPGFSADLDALGATRARLAQSLFAATGDPQRADLEQQIAAVDRDIDGLVYSLYDLPAGDIELIAKTTHGP